MHRKRYGTDVQPLFRQLHLVSRARSGRWRDDDCGAWHEVVEAAGVHRSVASFRATHTLTALNTMRRLLIGRAVPRRTLAPARSACALAYQF